MTLIQLSAALIELLVLATVFSAVHHVIKARQSANEIRSGKGCLNVHAKALRNGSAITLMFALTTIGAVIWHLHLTEPVPLDIHSTPMNSVDALALNDGNSDLAPCPAGATHPHGWRHVLNEGFSPARSVTCEDAVRVSKGLEPKDEVWTVSPFTQQHRPDATMVLNSDRN